MRDPDHNVTIASRGASRQGTPSISFLVKFELVEVVSELFRKEAISHATRRLSGDVVIASSLSSKLLAVVAVAVVLGGATFAATASYSRKETVSGWVAPSGGLIRLSARQGGVIEAVHVREGQAVTIGQPIATLRLSSALEAGDSFAALSGSLNDQAAAAKAKALAAQATLQAERQQLLARRSALTRELAETTRRAGLLSERVRLSKAEVARAETIAAQGFLPRRELEARRAAALSVEEEASSLASAGLAFQRDIGEVTARLNAIPIDIGAAEAEASSISAGLDQQRTQTEAQSTYVVVATVAGKIAALPVDVGQTVVPGASLGAIVPAGGRLEAELYAPSRAVGFVKRGQDVRLMYQAFPHEKFGTGRGVVSSVSPTVLAPSEVAIPGLQVQEPVFRVRVRLNRDDVEAYGQRVPLQPGMLLSADVVIDRRSLLEWLLDPLYAAGRRG